MTTAKLAGAARDRAMVRAYLAGELRVTRRAVQYALSRMGLR